MQQNPPSANKPKAGYSIGEILCTYIDIFFVESENFCRVGLRVGGGHKVFVIYMDNYESLF